MKLCELAHTVHELIIRIHIGILKNIDLKSYEFL